jgi:hypothetical protein
MARRHSREYYPTGCKRHPSGSPAGMELRIVAGQHCSSAFLSSEIAETVLDPALPLTGISTGQNGRSLRNMLYLPETGNGVLNSERDL